MGRKKSGSPATTSYAAEPPKVQTKCKHCGQSGLLGQVIFTYSTAPKVVTELHRGCLGAWRENPH